MKRVLLVVAVLTALSANVQAAEKYSIDKSHSSVGFSVDYLVISKTTGNFTEFDGSFTWDDADLSKAKIVGTIPAKSINTDNEKRDNHLRSEDFFWVEKHPTITFESTKIEKMGKGYVAHGTLTMRGVTKAIKAPFEITGKIKDFQGNPRIGLRSTFVINRKDFGINWNKNLDAGGVVVSDEVTIQLDIQVVNRGQ